MTRRTRRALAGALLCAALATAACGGGSQSATPPASTTASTHATLARANVLLVTIDTLRADRVGAYGNRQGLTPTLDRLAREGLRVDTVHAHVPLTLPSHTALMTGTYPFVNGVRDNGSFRFDGARPTLATTLKAAGYRTGAFVSAFVLDARFGLNVGFDVYDDRFGSRSVGGDLSVLERPADVTLGAATAWIGEGVATTPARPWFAWVHLYDPHEPYAAPEPFRTRFAADPYAGEVAFADAQLGAALERLTRLGQLADTVVVVAADHGESLGEHGERTHGLFAYDATMRVPLVIWAPPAVTPGVLLGPGRLVDVVPTVLDLVGVPAPAGNGQSLMPFAAAHQAIADTDVYFEALNANLTRHWAPLTGLVSKGLKFIDLPQPELYDLGADPGELTNLYATRQRDADPIARKLFAARASGRPAAPAAVDRETEQRLRSLGYLVAPANSAAKTYTAADDPKALVGLNNALDDALEALKAGRTAVAERELKQIIATRPDFTVAHDRLAQVYRDSGRLALAVDTLEKASKAGVADAALLAALGGYLQEAGQLDRSMSVLEAALKLNPSEMEIYEKLGITYTRVGRSDDAHKMFAHMLAVAPNSATTLNNLGSLYLSQRRWDEALASLTRAIAIDPAMANAYNGRGVAYAQQGQLDHAIVEWRKALELRPDLRDARDNIARAQQLLRQK
ncbi:MAG: sulfatase-like hydrolase/transferase [Acidobacteriota bacterium]